MGGRCWAAVLRKNLGRRSDKGVSLKKSQCSVVVLNFGLGFKICYSFFKFRNQRTFMTESTTRFGFVSFAETWNGRLAMLGFVIGLGTELLTGQGILGQVGLG